MKAKPNRQTVDLSAFSDLTVIYLGMKAHSLRGALTIAKIGPQIDKSVAQRPEGLILHESMFVSLFPLHVAMRQYWVNFESMERWTRQFPHQDWWKSFLKDDGGTGFWHEVYTMQHGMEGAFVNMDPVGMLRFASVKATTGSMYLARNRLNIPGEMPPSIVTEGELNT